MRKLTIALLLSGLAASPLAAAPPEAAPPSTTAAAMGAMMAKMPPGYLAGKPAVDILKVLPSPPVPGSAQDIADRTVYAASAMGIGGPGWAAASAQLNPTDAAFFAQMSCVVGAQISPKTTPLTMALITRAAIDFATPMDTAKKFYKRPRPFTTDHGKACDPVSADGVGEKLGWSYPSGHSGIGWLWALVLGDAAPAHATPIRAFGQGVGDHRIDCRVHWLSDVAYGRVLATAVYDRLAAEPEYRADVLRAAAELAKAPAAAGCS